MKDLNDSNWAQLKGGYRLPFDASVPLKQLKSSDQPRPDIWEQLWENLYHQGDVDEASYAALPHLIRIYEGKGWLDYNIVFFFAKVEEARREAKNPPLPGWVADDYQKSLLHLVRYAAGRIGDQWDYSTLQGFLLFLSILQGRSDLSLLIDFVEEGEAKRIMDVMYKY